MPERAPPPKPSLGKLLLRDGVLDGEQLASGLRQQVIYGGRLGTALLELGYAEHDEIATALAQLHGVPAALVRHLRSADPRAQAMVSARVCVERGALPLAFATAGGRRLVVCMRNPRSESDRTALANAAHMAIVAAACPERTLFRLLAHYFDAPLPARMTMQADRPATPLPSGSSGHLDAIATRELVDAPQLDAVDEPMPELSMPEISLVDLDHESARRDPSQIGGGPPLSLSDLADKLRKKRASEVPPFEDAPNDDAPVPSLEPLPAAPRVTETLPPTAPVPPTTERQPRRRRAASSLSEALLMAASERRIEAVLSTPVQVGPPPLDLAGALKTIEASVERSQVSDAVVAYLKTRFDAGLILAVSDEVAYGYRGFGGHFDDESVESILVPLSTTSPFQVAYQDRRRYVGAGGGDGRSLFGRFLRLFPVTTRPELCVVEPVEIRDRVVCLIYAHATGENPLADDELDNLGVVSRAVGDAFLRLIHAQRRD